MRSTTFVAALLVLLGSASARPEVVRPVVPLPKAVLASPAAETNPTLEATSPLSSSQALTTWAGPWVEHPGPYPPLYDHRYITW
jgi:hypothetical protein